MTDRPPLDPRYDPRFQRGFAAPEPAVWRPQEEVPPAGLIEVPRFERTPEPEKPAVDVAAPPDEDEPRNPWLLALLLVSVGFLAAGAGILISIAHRPSGVIDPSPVDMMLGQLSYVLSPALVVAGIVGLAIRLALGVVRR